MLTLEKALHVRGIPTLEDIQKKLLQVTLRCYAWVESPVGGAENRERPFAGPVRFPAPGLCTSCSLSWEHSPLPGQANHFSSLRLSLSRGFPLRRSTSSTVPEYPEGTVLVDHPGGLFFCPLSGLGVTHEQGRVLFTSVIPAQDLAQSGPQ